MMNAHPTDTPIPGHTGPPASATPIRDTFSRSSKGLSEDARYVVIPGGVLEQLSLPQQQQLAPLLDEIQRLMGLNRTPVYWVTPVGAVPVQYLTEQQRRESGITTGIDANDEITYMYVSTGEKIEDPSGQAVIVTVHDPAAHPTPDGTGA